MKAVTLHTPPEKANGEELISVLAPQAWLLSQVSLHFLDMLVFGNQALER